MKHIDDSIKLRFLMNETELAAIEHKIPMTQELFDSILDKMYGMQMEDFFFDFIVEHIDFLCVNAEKEEKLQELLDPEIHFEEEMLRIDKRWDDMCRRIREAYGEDVDIA